MQSITSVLESLANFVGICGCALVESETGMVWHHIGKLTDMERVGEAAIEFWRTQRRVAIQLEAMGELKFVNFKYANKTIVLVPCDEDRGLILVCLAESQGVNWSDWIKHLPALRLSVKNYVT
jgi:predicted regulator of Ras-like GTPase activity (Roadblock/LC7/MglB family)